ncbi:MAG TPA: acyl-CoA dehydrogenase family protein [Dehalococcoidia bacterium]|nr:acyl-CoA dehydrogenase family protein [Dehalococcoidia bacterium]
MDFVWKPEDEAFRNEVREFIKANLPPDWEEQALFGTDETYEVGRANAKKLAEKRWLTLAWPKEYGGQGASHWQQAIFNWENTYWRFPVHVGQGISLAGPTIMIYGTPEQKAHWLPRIASAEEMWCQLFTEPGAGSDLAALQTRAVRDGDDFVISGQKIFTSFGHHADQGWAGFRTDPTAPKHRGISSFIVNMHTPGITIRPMINMAGVHEVNEVFFDDVRVPKENLIGEENRGWYQMAATLDFERSGVQRYASATRMLEELVEFAKETRLNGHTLAKDPSVRSKLAQMFIEVEVGKYIGFKTISIQEHGQVPNREASCSKIFGAELTQRLANTGMSVLGLYGQLKKGSKWAAMQGRFEYQYLNAVVGTILAGSSEINRNIIASRGLGLPR